MYLLETVVKHPYSAEWPDRVDHTFFWSIPEWTDKRKYRDDVAVLTENAEYELPARFCDEVTGILKRGDDEHFDEYATTSFNGYKTEFWLYKFEDPYHPVMLKLILAYNAHTDKVEWDDRFPKAHYAQVELDSGEKFFASVKEDNPTHAFRVMATFSKGVSGGYNKYHWTTNFNDAYKQMNEWRRLSNCEFCAIEVFQHIGYIGSA